MITSIETDVMAQRLASADVDRQVVVELLDARGREMWGYARHLGLTPEEADDALQETLLRLWSVLGSGSDVRDATAWAYRTLQRVCVDEHRWQRRVRRVGERLGLTAPRSVELPAGDELGIWSAVERLPERQRLAVYLRYRADLSFNDIGRVLGIQPASARSHVSRGLETLRGLVSMEESHER
jgi:RNA polymerase sigma factor (sigma-70 family)